MSKIKISIKDLKQLEFIIDQDAKAGDYISLNDLKENDFESILDFFKTKEEEYLHELGVKNKVNIINEFKSSEEYLKTNELIQNLKTSNQLLQKELESTKNNIINEFKSSAEYIDLLKSNEKLESNLKNIQNKIEAEHKILLLQKDQEIKNAASNLEHTIKQLTTDHKLQLETTTHKLQQEWNNEKTELQDTINRLERSKTINTNSKVIGEEFENWIFEQLNTSFSFDENVRYRKTTQTIQNNKPDFLFEVVANDVVLTTVVMEAKTKSITSTTTKKNSDYLPALLKNTKTNNGNYSLLITELEDNDKFTIKKVVDTQYPNTFICRPEYVVLFLQIIRCLALANKNFYLSQIDFKNKQEIVQEFEAIKTAILENSVSSLTKKIDEIKKHNDQIINATKNIDAAIGIIINTHLQTIKNKLEQFAINKLIKKIDKLDETNENSDKKLEFSEELIKIENKN